MEIIRKMTNLGYKKNALLLRKVTSPGRGETTCTRWSRKKMLVYKEVGLWEFGASRGIFSCSSSFFHLAERQFLKPPSLSAPTRKRVAPSTRRIINSPQSFSADVCCVRIGILGPFSSPKKFLSNSRGQPDRWKLTSNPTGGRINIRPITYSVRVSGQVTTLSTSLFWHQMRWQDFWVCWIL